MQGTNSLFYQNVKNVALCSRLQVSFAGLFSVLLKAHGLQTRCVFIFVNYGMRTYPALLEISMTKLCSKSSVLPNFECNLNGCWCWWVGICFNVMFQVWELFSTDNNCNEFLHKVRHENVVNLICSMMLFLAESMITFSTSPISWGINEWHCKIRL